MLGTPAVCIPHERKPADLEDSCRLINAACCLRKNTANGNIRLPSGAAFVAKMANFRSNTHTLATTARLVLVAITRDWCAASRAT